MQRISDNPATAAPGRSWTGCRLVGAVPPAYCRDGTEWLSVEHCTRPEGGYFLFRRRLRGAPPVAESWHPTLDAALREAERSWGIGRGCWTVE